MKKAVIVAHPDDETLYFAGVILSDREADWTVVCVTDGDAEGRGASRALELRDACGALGVHTLRSLRFKDDPRERIPLPELERLLAAMDFDEVYTHGILGEYGHAHHQDVSLAVHRAFEGRAQVVSVATGSYPSREVRLTRAQFEVKLSVLRDIYRKETQRFLGLIPASPYEGFAHMTLHEAEAAYGALCGRAPWRDLDVLSGFQVLLEEGVMDASARAFFAGYGQVNHLRD
jgi:LmbE family N-acetylglucosaminyl deacetylase